MLLWLASVTLVALHLSADAAQHSPRRTPPSSRQHLFVDPERGDDHNDGLRAASALRTVASAQQRVRQMLSQRPQSGILVELSPGRHRVARGGLLLDARDSPADGHSVHWRGTPGKTSLSGGEPVSGWKPTVDPALPPGVYSAPAPATLHGVSARHLFVDGSRAVRTRRNATQVLPGLRLEIRSDCQACSYSVKSSADVLSWSNPGDVEFVYSGVLASWAEERCTVDSFGPSPPPPPLPPPLPPGSCSGVIHIHHTEGCFNYSDWTRDTPGSVFPIYAPSVDGTKLTLESCAAECYKTKATTGPSLLAGVLDGSRCFCGTAANLSSASATARALPKGACETVACEGRPQERACGGIGTMLVYAYSCDRAAATNNSRVKTQPSLPDGQGVLTATNSSTISAAATTATMSASGLGGAGANSTRITMKQPCFWNLVKGRPLSMGNITPAYVDNVREHLSVPGQWYFDKAKQEVLYYPLPGQDLSKLEVIIAIEETLVSHQGVQNHAWDGISFEFGTWLRPMQGAGFVEEQSGACDVCPYGVSLQKDCGEHDSFVVMPANVVVSAGRNIDFVNCTFQHLGAYAASALNGSQNVSWRGCTFQDVSGGGLALGDVNTWDVTDTASWDKNFLVEDNVLANLPVEYTGAAALFAGYVGSTTIQHNHIVNTTYSGISIGWGWGHESSRHGNNHIIANKIERVLQSSRCCDGGGIYTLGPQPGSSLQRNYLLHAAIERPGYGPFGHGGSAMYHDQGSGGFTDTENVIVGPWDSWTHVRPFGWKCPGVDGQAVDCAISVTKNWVRSNGTSTCSVRSATCHKVDPGFSVSGNIRLAPSADLPPAAASIVAAAGPRQPPPVGDHPSRFKVDGIE